MWDLVEDAENNNENTPLKEEKRERDMNRSQWMCSEIAKPHSGSIWRLSWAHPEFGQVLSEVGQASTKPWLTNSIIYLNTDICFLQRGQKCYNLGGARFEYFHYIFHVRNL